MPLPLPLSLHVRRSLRRTTPLALVACTLLLVIPLAAHAGGNSGAAAYLTWTATDKTDSDRAGDQAIVDLFVYVERAAGLSFKGAELDLTWMPPGDGEACLVHTGDLYRTSTTCTYLNRGTPVPVVTVDEPGHYHVAWANTASVTTCTSGAIVQMQFAIDGCADPSACFVLNSLTLLDAVSLSDAATIVGWNATINGGSQYCSNTNSPPVLNPIGPKSVESGVSLYFLVSASDADGDVLTYAAEPLPPGATFTSRQFSWVPTDDQTGDWNVLFTVVDPRGQADSENVTITVLPGYCLTEQAPVFVDTPDQMAETGFPLSFSVFASDPEGDAVTYTALSLPPGASFSVQTFSWTPALGDTGSFEAVFRAADHCEMADTDTVVISVRPNLAVHYVDPTSACTVCDGSSWQNAMHTVGAAFAVSDAGDSLLIAEGMYLEGPLTLPTTMTVVGGYAAGGGEHDASRHRTVLMPAVGFTRYTILSVGSNGSRLDGLTLSGAVTAVAALDVHANNVTVLGTFITGNTNTSYPLFISGSNVQVFGCLVTNNSVYPYTPGAPVWVSIGASATISNCTIAYNMLGPSQPDAGGVYNDGTSTVRNTIVWAWSPSTPPPFVNHSGTLQVGYSDVQGGWPGAGNINADPLFCNPSKRNYGLKSGSPCIGAGYHGSTIGAIDKLCGTAPDLPPIPVIGNATSPEPEQTGTTVRATVEGGGAITVAYTLPRAAGVALDVFDTRGAHVRTLVSARESEGPHVVAWNGLDDRGRRVAAGIYVVRLVTDTERVSRRLVIAH